MNHEALNRTDCKVVSPEPTDETEHFMVCPQCGQAFDCRLLGDVLHHDEPGHEPLPVH